MKRKESSNRKVTLVMIVVAATFFLGMFLGNSINGLYMYTMENDMVKISSLSTDGFAEADITIDPGLIYLTDGCRRLSMVTTTEQTTSIYSGMAGIKTTRPLVHDIMKNQFEAFDIKIIMVKINTLENRTYHANLITQYGNRVLEMDARPSDAIALAVRMDAPIYVSNVLMEEEGQAIC